MIQLPQNKAINGVYLHIPFCRSICPFCAFPVMPNRIDKHQSYLRLVHNEITLLIEEIKPDFSQLSSVYFGGGTPSALPGELLMNLAKYLRSFTVNNNCQWSIEINPEDGTSKLFEVLIGSGFNRFSLGVQSFNDTTLDKISRNHTANDSHSAIALIRDLGIIDFNIDIMFGIPGQTMQDLEKDLYETIEKNPTHISAYILNIEPKTKLFRKPEWQKWQAEHERFISKSYLKVIEILSKNGFQQYEISNFSKPGFESQQNLINWHGKNYLGIGMGAHSFIDGYRWGNFRRWKEYNENIRNSNLPFEFSERLNINQTRDEYLMIHLRLVTGIELKKFNLLFNCDLMLYCNKQFEQLKERGWIDLQNGLLKLTSSGMLLADEIVLNLCTLLPD